MLRWFFVVVCLLGFSSLGQSSENLTHAVDDEYQTNQVAIARLKQVKEPTELILFHGAWCADCQREVPRLMAVLQEVDNDRLQLVEYEVGRDKQDVLGKFEDYGIRMVPTIIVLQGGRELGRVVESPENSLEEDLANILSRK